MTTLHTTRYKKLLCAGNRGAKDKTQDVQEAISSLLRYLEMQTENEIQIVLYAPRNIKNFVRQRILRCASYPNSLIWRLMFGY